MRHLKLALRQNPHHRTVVSVGDARFGGDFLVIAGPCAVESREQMLTTAEQVCRCGAKVLRGGAFKPRTNPYSFQGLGYEGLEILREAGRLNGTPIVTEVMDPRDVERMLDYAEILQIGARNMQNYSLLKEVGRVHNPVLLKRGPSATIEEWLSCAEYILASGNPNVILCERGIRTFETATRNTLDLSAVALVKTLTHLPVVVDPSHSGGLRELVEPLSLAAIAAGADGLIIEVHCNPAAALCDREQSLPCEEFGATMKKIDIMVATMQRLKEPVPVS